MPAHHFETTHWTGVFAAGRGSDTQSAAALECLCQAYWFPLYAYTRRRGYDVEAARDLTQDFFAHLLAKNWVGQADRTRGKFRCFLLSALDHFLANDWRRGQTLKRGGRCQLVSLDDTAESRYSLEPAGGGTPAKEYERHWALTLFERARECLRKQYASSGKQLHYDLLKDYLWREGNETEYTEVSRGLGITTAAVSSAVHRLRERYRKLVFDEIAQTVHDPSEIHDEMRSLLNALSSS